MINYKVSVERDIAISHRLTKHDGKCSQLHGHNLTVIVEIHASKLLEEGSSTGMVVDFGTVKKIIDRYDHTHLNDSLAEDGVSLDIYSQPTAERFAELVTYRLIKELDNKSIYHINVKVYEAKGQYAEFEWSGIRHD